MILGRGAPNSGGDGLGTRRPDGGGRWTQPSLPASHVQRASQVLLGFRLGEVARFGSCTGLSVALKCERP